jgi:anti-sigma factor RsiW
MTERDDPTPHLDDHAMARYVDGDAGAEERAQTERHLATCAECRAELLAIRQLVKSRPARRWSFLMPAAAAAAVVLAVWIGMEHGAPTSAPSVTRDHLATTALAPRPLSPVGSVARIDSIAWTGAADARRYRLTVYSSTGQPLWQSTTSDTVVALPDSLRGAASPVAFWQVKAESRYGRWIESELVAVTVVPAPPR